MSLVELLTRSGRISRGWGIPVDIDINLLVEDEVKKQSKECRKELREWTRQSNDSNTAPGSSVTAPSTFNATVMPFRARNEPSLTASEILPNTTSMPIRLQVEPGHAGNEDENGESKKFERDQDSASIPRSNFYLTVLHSVKEAIQRERLVQRLSEALTPIVRDMLEKATDDIAKEIIALAVSTAKDGGVEHEEEGETCWCGDSGCERTRVD